MRVAFVHGVPLGVGGLGVQSGNALRALAQRHEVHAIGPGPAPDWPVPPGVVWHVREPRWNPFHRIRPLRRHSGLGQHLDDSQVGAWARLALERIRPDLCYAFTQVAAETLAWARTHHVPGVLESPNGHIRRFRDIYVSETRRWCHARFSGHPTSRMVARVESEYSLASHIRVSSKWSQQSLLDGGVAGCPIAVLQQPVDISRFAPSAEARADDEFRICFVGTLDVRKGFVYLLRALRLLNGAASLTCVGNTGDRGSRMLFESERRGLSVSLLPGDPRTALRRSDIFVLPTLEDGSPFAVAEAMASAVPVVTTTATGAAEWITPEVSGWVVAPANERALATALSSAMTRRHELSTMGRAARIATESRVQGCDEALSAWVESLSLRA